MSNPRTLGPWLRRFLAEHIVTERNLARNTQRTYRDTFVLLLPFVGARTRKPLDRLAVQDLSARRVLQFLAHLEDHRGCSAQTRNQRLAAMRLRALRRSRDPGHLEWSANIRAIALKKTTPQPIGWLSKTEMKTLLQVPDRRTPRGRIEHALLLFLYNTGARVSEATNLAVGDLQIGRRDGGHALVAIHGKGGKRRQCPLWPRTERVLVELVQARPAGDAVFLSRQKKPYTRFGVYRLVERCAARVPSLAGRTVTNDLLKLTATLRAYYPAIFPNRLRGQFNGQHKVGIIRDHYSFVKFIVYAVQHQIGCQINVSPLLLGSQHSNSLGWAVPIWVCKWKNGEIRRTRSESTEVNAEAR